MSEAWPVVAAHTGIPRARVVAVVAVLGGGREQVGSGYLVGGRLVLTAAHCTWDKKTGSAPLVLRVIRATDGAVAEVTDLATNVIRALDVAVVRLTDAPWEPELPPPVFARVDRSRSGILPDCSAIGYPLFQRDPVQRARRTAELHGVIYQTDEAEVGRLLLREPLLTSVAHAEPPPDANVEGDPTWGGLSGALVFHAGQALGVIIEHHPRQGSAAVQLMPFDSIRQWETDETARRVADALGLPALDQLPWVAAQSVAPSVKPDELPNDIEHFSDRRQELATLRAHLESHCNLDGPAPVLSICGAAGVGKSALATHFAHEISHRYSDGQLYFLLRTPGGTAEESEGRPVPAREVLDGFLRSYGVTTHDPLDLNGMANRYRSILGTKRVLVFLDNAADVEQVRPLLPNKSTSVALVTSRRCFYTSGWTRPLKLVEMSPGHARDMLARLVGEERLSDDYKSAEKLVQLCGYLPLAIRIVAAKLLTAPPDWPISHFIERLDDERQRLVQLRYDDLDVRASFQVSYQDIPAPVQRMFRLLALFPGIDFTAEVAAVLTGSSFHDVQGLLDRLVEAQLLEPARVPGRYQFHDLLRLFGRELSVAEDSGAERSDVFARVAKWYTTVAGAADRVINPVQPPTERDSLRFPTHHAALSWFDQERANLLAVFERAKEDDPAPVVWQLAIVMAHYFELKNYWLDWEETHKSALEVTRLLGARAAEARILLNLGAAYRYRQRYEDAVNCYQQSVVISRQLADRSAEAWALLGLGVTDAVRHRHRHQAAAGSFQAGLEIFREIADRYGEAWVLAWNSKVLRSQHNFGEAIAGQEEALRHFRQAGDRYGEAWVLDNVGSTYYEMERLDEALDAEERAVELFRAVGNRHEQAWVLADIGHVHRKAARFSDAVRSYEQALALFRELGDRGSEAETLNFIAAAWRDSGNFDAAVTAHELAVSVYQDLADPGGEGRALNVLARTLRARGRFGAAVDKHKQALAVLRADEPAFRDSVAWVLQELGDTYRTQGRLSDAVESYKDSLEMYRFMGDRYREATILERLGDTVENLHGPASALPYWRNAFANFSERRDPEAIALQRKIAQA